MLSARRFGGRQSLPGEVEGGGETLECEGGELCCGFILGAGDQGG